MSARDALDRLRLSMLVEPGDARVCDLLSTHPAGRVVEACVTGRSLPGGIVLGGGLPEPWVTRARAGAADAAADLLADARRRGLRWVCPGGAEWPAGLDDLDLGRPVNGARGAPLGVWVRGGRLDELVARSVAVVGARDGTTYGTEVAGDLGADLADAGVCVVSGAAFGIDAAAHRGAMSMRGTTVAVLACGVDVDYPRAHAGMLGLVAETGAVVSEQLPGQGPTKARFLSRNRLIAALSQGTVVVEAARRSGALNTLNWATSIARVTMGVPGPVTSRASVGVHQALREGQVIVVTNGREVIEAVSPVGTLDTTPASAPATALDALPSGARMVLEAVPTGDGADVVSLARHLGARPEDVGVVLDDLLAQGWVGVVDGRWSLARRADLSPPVG
ncbi:DNA-processing protein DprA [Solicola sp. PLA-1-18]|uniref:DNA-processing protein DprA n=1 Tax=Solicola sp. PLA-1-18 TaxID=3380532 RepID=UPI003B76ED91